MSAGSSTRNSIELGVSSNQEIVQSKEKKRNKPMLMIAGFSAVIILIIVIIVIVTELTSDGTNERDPTKGFELDDYLNGRFNYERFNGTWITGTEFMYKDKLNGSIIVYDVFSNTSRELLTLNDEPLLKISFLHQLSSDQKYLLLAYDYKKLWRHSYLANYTAINLDTKEAINITVDGEDSKQLLLVKWSPRENGLVFVYENNLYYQDKVEGGVIKSITFTGSVNIIYNGVPDWVYEEEIFGSNDASWFSPDGRKLAYITFNDTNVRTMSFPWYGGANNYIFQYPATVNIKYPKSGTTNPVVTLSVIDLDKLQQGTGVSIQLKPPSDVGTDHVIASVTWSTINDVAAVWMNRVQNMFVLTNNNADTGNPVKVLKYEEPNGWVEMFSQPEFSTNGSQFITILPAQQSNGELYRHVTMATSNSGGNAILTSVTKGNFVVTKIAAWDKNNKKIYYLATGSANQAETDPANQHLYSITEDGLQDPICLSCGIKIIPERLECTHVSATFSPDYSYYILTCNGPDIPGVLIVKTDNTSTMLWEDNSELATFINSHSLPTRKRYWVDVPNGMKAYVQLWCPPGMDTSGVTKYPLLINVYGGPDSVQVTDRWSADWGAYLTTNRSFIYGSIDGRASGLKGNKILFSGYRHFGTVEIEDQINVTKHLQNTLPWIDKTRTAIWGWSYGGYSTGMALAKDSEGVFRCGMSVAPVTDWAYYDSLYTERYMGLPTPVDNMQGYLDGNLNNHVENLGRNMDRYMLIHGNADDNVHYQQSMILSRTLELANILFRQQSYPDEAHGLNGVNSHLYHTLEHFLDQCLNLTNPNIIY